MPKFAKSGRRPSPAQPYVRPSRRATALHGQQPQTAPVHIPQEPSLDPDQIIFDARLVNSTPMQTVLAELIEMRKLHCEFGELKAAIMVTHSEANRAPSDVDMLSLPSMPKSTMTRDWVNQIALSPIGELLVEDKTGLKLHCGYGIFVPKNQWKQISEMKELKEYLLSLAVAALKAMGVDPVQFKITKSSGSVAAQLPPQITSLVSSFVKLRMASKNHEFFSPRFSQAYLEDMCPEAAKAFDLLTNSTSSVPNGDQSLGTLGSWLSEVGQHEQAGSPLRLDEKSIRRGECSTSGDRPLSFFC